MDHDDRRQRFDHVRWKSKVTVDQLVSDFGIREPFGRYGTPEEVSALCVFLASERAGFITGVSYNVDGGFTDFAY